MKKFLLHFLALLSFLPSNADTVLLEESFDDGTYNKSFPYVYDGDELSPSPKVSAIFLPEHINHGGLSKTPKHLPTHHMAAILATQLQGNLTIG